MALDVKQAIRRARDALTEYYEEQGVEDLRLEEVELVEDEPVWRITLSFQTPALVATHKVVTDDALDDLLRRAREEDRFYKVFEIFADTGEVRSMKIRQL